MTKGSAAVSKLTDRDEFRFLADLVFKHSSGDHTFVSLHDQRGGTVRFANNQVVQNVDTRRISFSVTVAFGRRHGSAGTTDLTAGSVQETLKRAERLARVSPEDPEYLPPVDPQSYSAWPVARPETTAAGPAGRLAYAREAIELCRGERLTAAGIVSSSAATVGVAANTGLFAHEERTEARFSLTAQHGEASGWVSAAHRSIDRLAVRERTQVAIDKARRSVGAKEMPAGRYVVILEAPAVAGLLTWFIWMLDAKAFYRGTSPFSGKLNQRIVDPRLSMKNRPDHPDLLGYGFTSEGLPVNASTWIDAGVLRQLSYDRFTAKEHGIDRIATLESPLLSGDGSAKPGLEDLIRSTIRGVLITNFWYIRPVNPTDLTLTGMTRDGTFLIEDGRITTAVRNFRFHDSPLRAFNAIDAFTLPQEAVTAETGKLLVPAMKIREFNFSSVTRF